MVDRADKVQVMFGVETASNLKPAKLIVENVPFVGIAQGQRVACQEDRSGKQAGRIDGKRVHALNQHCLYGIVQLNVARKRITGDRLEHKLSIGFLGHTGTPRAKRFKPNTTRPAGLNAPDMTLRPRNCRGGQNAQCRGR